VSKMLSNAIFPLMVIAAFGPVWFPFMPGLEGKILPATSKMEIIEKENLEDGTLLISTKFEKKRYCEFIGMTVIVDGRKMEIESSNTPARFTSYTLPVGYYFGGPWEISWPVGTPPAINNDVVSTDDMEITLRHNCHPLWPTITKFYP